MTKEKIIVNPLKIRGLQNEVNKNLWAAFEKQNPDYIDCLNAFHKMPLSKRKEIFGIKSQFSWAEQQEKIQNFYNKVYEILGLPAKEIDWASINVPEYSEDFPTLEYIDRSISGKQWIQVYKKIFGDISVYGNDYSKDIEKMTKEQQSRPEGNYCIARRNTVEPDNVHLNKSYDDFHNDNRKYMIPIEGIISALRYRMETGNMLDVKGVTRFHALYSDVHVLNMYGNDDGQFYLGWFNPFNRMTVRGPREVNF